MEPLLKACCVSYSYHSPEGATPALFQVSFTVDPGEFLAIVGPSGCGKSTLLSLLSGLLEPEEGAIYIEDTPLKEASTGIGYMLQRVISSSGAPSGKTLRWDWRSSTRKPERQCRNSMKCCETTAWPPLHPPVPLSFPAACASGRPSSARSS